MYLSVAIEILFLWNVALTIFVIILAGFMFWQKKIGAAMCFDILAASDSELERIMYQKIESYKDLKVGQFYWLRSREFGSLHVDVCRGDESLPNQILGHWVTEENHEYTFDKYEIFGPISKPLRLGGISESDK